MKKLKTTLILSTALFLAGTSSFADTALTATETTTGLNVKYIAIAVAVVIVVLLLFLGYKMDSKGDDTYKVKKTKKSPKVKKEEDIKYEPDNLKYEDDTELESSDMNETTEYDEDEDESVFSYTDEDDFSDLEVLDSSESEEDAGEEFDTSIIDDIEDEEDIEIPKTKVTKTTDETMVFDKPVTNSIEDEIDSLDMPEPEEKVEETDPLMNELNNIDKTEPSFDGFSSKTSNETVDKKPEIKEEKPKKKYTKVVKNSSTTSDFLAQMEETMLKDKEERDRKSK